MTFDTAPVSERVVERVAEKRGVDQTELEPLYYSVAPECLDELFPASAGRDHDAVRQFTFTYEDYVVKVSDDGTVEVFPAGGRTPDLSPTERTTGSDRGDPETPD